MGLVRRRRRTKPDHDLPLANDGVLPVDVLLDVLLYLPADAICRLRLVCRSWRSLTSDPTFAKAHASRHPLLAGVSDGEVCVVDLFSGDIIRWIAPTSQPRYGMNSQIDLACISAFSTRERSSVLNLATGETITTFLPDSQERDTDMMSPFLLGHIPSTGELKAFYSHVRCGRGGDELVQICYAATLIGIGGSRRWRRTPSPPAFVGSGLRDSVVIAGVAYILLSTLYSQRDILITDMEPDAMAVFDMAREVWRPETLRGPLSSRLTGAAGEMQLVYNEHRADVRLAAVDGCLVTVHHNRGPDCSMDLWFLVDMDVDKGMWTKRYSVRCEARCEMYKSPFSNSYPLLLLDDGRITMWEERTDVLSVRSKNEQVG